MRLRWLVLIVALALGWGYGTGPNAAEIGTETPVSLQPGRPPDDAWPVIEQELRRLPTKIDGMISDTLEDELHAIVDRGKARTRKEAFAYLLQNDIAWGYADIEGDGVDEMLVWLGLPVMCGSAGCQTLILHRGAGGWKQAFFASLGDPDGSLCYARDGPDGFPMIRSDTDAFWWDGKTLRSVCYAYCIGFGDRDAISENELKNATPEELSVRALLHDRPWCGNGGLN
jgi:hypothetical protein